MAIFIEYKTGWMEEETRIIMSYERDMGRSIISFVVLTEYFHGLSVCSFKM